MKNQFLILSGVLFFILLFTGMSHLTSWAANFLSCGVVISGTIVCSILNSPWHAVSRFSANLCSLFNSEDSDFKNIIEEISSLARSRRMGGLAELDRKSEEIENSFLKKGIELVVDGFDNSSILSTLEQRLQSDISHKKEQNELINSMMKLSPVFGFAGTIIGLIQVLNNMTSPELIGEGMGTALLTTFYGLIFANLVFLPLSKKAANILKKETIEKSIIIEGVLDISNNMNSKAVMYRLTSSVGGYAVSNQTQPELVLKKSVINS